MDETAAAANAAARAGARLTANVPRSVLAATSRLDTERATFPSGPATDRAMTSGLRRGAVPACLFLSCSSPSGDAAPDFGPGPGVAPSPPSLPNEAAPATASDGVSAASGAVPGLGFVEEVDSEAPLGTSCGGTVFEPERLPLDLFFLVDSSGSMAEPAGGGASKWNLMSSALVDFLSDPSNAEVGVGVGFFPENVQPTCTSGQPDCLCIPVINICFSNVGGSCAAADYAAPSVPLALPPSAATAIGSIQRRELAGGTPTRAALEGTYQYLETWTSQNPGRKLATILATDGEPNGCIGNTPAEAARLAAQALSGPSQIQTFVIGVGRSLGNLGQVAQAGGTSQAFLIDATQDLAQGFARALESIRVAAGPCAFEIPISTAEGPVDPGRVNVRFTPSGATEAVVVAKTFDGSVDGCGADGGWYYDNPSAPTRIQLCSNTCEGTLEARVDVQFGCDSVVQPPR